MKHINKKNMNSKNKSKCKNKCKSKCKSKKHKSLKGGVFLGKGSYGCVVKPALSCNDTRYTTYNNKTKKQMNEARNKSVSKIIIDPSQDNDKDELIISSNLKEIDKGQQHFITFNEYCPLKTVPTNRSNTARVNYDNRSLSHFKKLDEKKYDRDFCPIDLRLKPINFIMPYGGFDLVTIIENKTTKQDLSHFTITKDTLLKDFRSCFKNLLFGLHKMHSIRIVNRDIKNENIMANYNDATKQVMLRFIDFGLSTKIPSFYKNKKYIDLRGSERNISPELIISYYINNSEKYNDTMKYVYDNVKLPIDKLKDYNSSLTAFNYKDLYYKIQNEFQNNTIYDKFFGINDDEKINQNKFNGYLQKGDVYALGISMCVFLKSYKPYIIYNTLLRDLLVNMIHPDPERRFNIIRCLRDPYFA